MIIQLGIAHEREATTIVGIVPDADGMRTVVYCGTHLEGDSAGTIQLDDYVRKYPEDTAQAVCRMLRERGQAVGIEVVREWLSRI